jgi:hypothetical protein
VRPTLQRIKNEYQATIRDDICPALEFGHIKLRPRAIIWPNGNTDSNSNA